jgi:lathosterol oxidase
MDLVLRLADEYVLDNVWALLVPPNDNLIGLSSKFLSSANLSTTSIVPQSAWPRDHIPRQLLSLSIITLIATYLTYFIFAGLSFQFIFNHEMMQHPRFLTNQIKLEIQTSLKSIPVMTLLTLPWFQAEVLGYSRLYDDVDEYGWLYLGLSIPWYASFR